MPGNPVRLKPERDLSAIPGTLSPEENRQRIKSEDEAMKAFIASMPEGDVLDYLRAPFNLFSNSMAGLGAEMIGKGEWFEKKYGWKPKTQAEMNAVNSLLEVMDPAIAAMDYLKIPPVVGPNVPTIAAAMRGVDRAAVNLSGQQAAAAAKKGATAAKNAVRDVATSDAAYDIMNRLAEATGTAPKQIMMGPMSKTWDHGNAALAKHMELQGKNPREIWQATGTFRGADGLWRQEIPDVDMRYTGNAVERKQYESAKKRHEQATARATTPEEVNDANDYWNKTRTDAIFNLTGKTPDFINHPELFAAYPELSKLAFKQLQPTHKEFTAPETVYGFYSPTKQRITINTDAPQKKSTALHELQHAIQEIEGWQGGSSSEYMATKLAERDVFKDSLQKQQELLNSLSPTSILRPSVEKSLQEAKENFKPYEVLEGLNPYDAYRRVSGEEEARMVQARRDYDERSRKDSFPVWNYETPPSEQITKNFANGGAMMMAKGGFLGVLERTAKQGVERAAKAAKVDIPPMGINVRTDSKLNIPFADLIVDGQKVYESRKSDSLRPYVNKSMSIVRTGNGPAKAIGSVEIGEPMIVDAKTFREMQDKHLVPEGSMFDIEAEGQKYLYPLSNSRRFDQELDVGHGIKARKVIFPDDLDKKKGGEVRMSGGGRTGILGALARTAERGVERAAKAVKPIESVVQVSTIKMPKAAQEVVSDAERAANLAKFLEQSKRKKRLYHGTNSDFSVFDAGRAGENTDSNASSEAYAQTARLGHWLNTNPMAGPKAGYDVDMPVYVSIKNPKREMSLDSLAQGLEGTTGKEYRDQLIKEGYDGIVLPDEEFGGESWVAFSPEQIKSALGNRGTYDINEKDITKADGGDITIDEFLNRMKAR